MRFRQRKSRREKSHVGVEVSRLSTNRLEKELLKLKEKVRRSEMGDWEKYQAYQLISQMVKLIDLVG
jgi:hypothetical protein